MVEPVRLKLSLQTERLLTQISPLNYFIACLHNQFVPADRTSLRHFCLKPVLAVLKKSFLGRDAHRASQKGFNRGQSSLWGQLSVLHPGLVGVQWTLQDLCSVTSLPVPCVWFLSGVSEGPAEGVRGPDGKRHPEIHAADPRGRLVPSQQHDRAQGHQG